MKKQLTEFIEESLQGIREGRFGRAESLCAFADTECKALVETKFHLEPGLVHITLRLVE